MVCVALLCACRCFAQGEGAQAYSRKNTFAVFAEYSNESSRFALGQAPKRRFGGIGGQYERRLLARNKVVLSYSAEVRPALFESDPTITFVQVQTQPTLTITEDPYYVALRCTEGARDYTYMNQGVTYSGREITRCGREVSFTQGLSPAGARLSFWTNRPVQLTLSTHEGYLFATHPIPVPSAGSFNWTFEVGAGVEWYGSDKRSMRLEWQLQHYSNAFSAAANPGVDSGLFKLTYAFGR